MTGSATVRRAALLAAVTAIGGACSNVATERAADPANNAGSNGGSPTSMDAGSGGAGEASAGSGGEDVTAPNCDCPAPMLPIETPPARPLECLCGSKFCPESVEDAVANSIFKCSVITIREGCGLRVVHERVDVAYHRYSFDIETRALVGVVLVNDVPYLDCGSEIYAFGEPEEACEQYSECAVCPEDGGVALPTCE